MIDQMWHDLERWHLKLIRALLEAKAREFEVVAKVGLKVLTMGLEEKLNKSSRIKSNLQGCRIWPFWNVTVSYFSWSQPKYLGPNFLLLGWWLLLRLTNLHFCEENNKNKNWLIIDGIGGKNYCMHIALKSLSKYIFILYSIVLKTHGCLECLFFYFVLDACP